MKKLTKFTLLIICLFFIKISGVSATAYSDASWPGCVGTTKCLPLCGYNNTYTGNDTYKTTMNTSSYIYYNFSDKEIYIDFYTPVGTQKSTKTSKVAFSNSKVHSQVNYTKNNFSCPKYSYIDTSSIGLTEVCFDNDGKYCKKQNGFATKFQGDSSRKYNFQRDITNYYSTKSNYTFGLTCKTFSLNKAEDKFVADFRDNYLKGHGIVDFIKNSDAYKDGKATQQKSVETFRDNCISQIKNDTSLSDSEKQKTLSNLNVSNKDIKDMLDKVEDRVKVNAVAEQTQVDISKATCDSILGSVKVDGTPAYYLNKAFDAIKYIAIIMLIVFSMIDYLKAVAAKDSDEFKKANSNLIKRLITCAIILVLPSLINLLLSWTNVIDLSAMCGTGSE